MADPGDNGEMAPKGPTIFLLCKKTDFRIIWPTPQVVIMQKGVQH